jgi:hypothetical protein
MSYAIPILTGGLIAAPASFEAYSQIQQGKSAQRWNEYNARLAERDAEVARMAAGRASVNAREEARRLRARQIAGLSKSGVTMEGSPLLVLAQSAENEETDLAMMEYNASVQSNKMDRQAVLDRYSGRIAMSNARMAATGSLISGAAKIASVGASYGGAA